MSETLVTRYWPNSDSTIYQARDAEAPPVINDSRRRCAATTTPMSSVPGTHIGITVVRHE